MVVCLMKDTELTEMGNIYISSEQIIQEVQKFRCLYDPSDPDHKDRDVMRDAWLSVTSAVVGEPWANLNSAEKNEAEKDLKRKWKDMRDTFVKSLKRESVRSPRDGRIGIIQKKRPYIHHKEMSFLLETDHYKEYLSCGTDVSSKPPSATETIGTVRSDDVAGPRPDFRILRPGQNIKSPPRPFNLSMLKDNTFERDDSSTSCHSSFSVPHQASNPEPENPDRMFLLSLLPRVSALNSRDKMDFQIGIMQLLQGYETEDSSS